LQHASSYILKPEKGEPFNIHILMVLLFIAKKIVHEGKYC